MADMNVYQALDELYQAKRGARVREGNMGGAEVWHVPLKDGAILRQGARGHYGERVKWYELSFPDGEDPIRVTKLAPHVPTKAHEEIVRQTLSDNLPKKRK